jgi:photosystem II stability/assembly factor-like uncharacterized protein
MTLRVAKRIASAVLAGVLVLSAPALATGGWHILSGAPAELGNTVTCFKGTDCWTPARGSIWASNDGGRSWHRQRIPPGGAVRAVSCISASDCWATFDRRRSAGVIATANGGRSWHVQPVPKGASDLERISCTPDGGCVAVGLGRRIGAFFAPLAFASTQDGGAHWSIKQLEVSGGPHQFVLAFMYGVSCANAHDCWAAGQRSNCPHGHCVGNLDTVEATRDGGATWHLQRTPNTGDLFWDISCPNVHDCWAAGRTGEGAGARGVVIATSDGGVHWQAQRTPSESRTFNGISCTSAGDCTATGWNGSTALIAKTTNGGATWYRVSAPAGVTGLGSISCSARGYCLATGSIGFGSAVRPILIAN